MKPSSLTLKQLRYFAHVVEAGSISRAAEKLHVAQTALGLQVRALEEVLGTPLLWRRHWGVVPTEAGRHIYERAGQLLQSVDALPEEVASLAAGGHREILLGLPPSLMRGIGPGAVLHEREKLPGIHLHLVEALRDQLVEGLRSGEFKYVFAHDVASDRTLHSLPVLRQKLVLVTRPGCGLKPGPVRFADAVGTDIVVRGGTSHAFDVVKRVAGDLGLSPNIVYEIDSLSALKQVVLQCGATAILTADLVIEEVARSELEVHEIVEPPLELTLQFAMRCANTPTDADLPVLEFLDGLLDEFLQKIGTADRRLGHLTTLSATALAAAATTP